MSRAAPLLAALLALLLTLLPARAQVPMQLSWWLAGGSTAPVAGLGQTASWWLGGTTASNAANVTVAQSVGWWLGNAGSAPTPVRADETLRWWLGSAAQASAEETAEEAVPLGPEPPNYASWEEVARAAEAATEDPATTNLALERTRARISEWRERFLTAQNANRSRIDTIRNQLSALGPAPGEGEVEAAEIAQRRAALNEQLATLQAPGIAAEEAYRRADGLIREIDAILRERQANELLELAPSPLVPMNWGRAYDALADLGTRLWEEGRTGWLSETSRAAARENLPATILFLAFGIALIGRARTWSEAFAERVRAGTGRRARRAVLALLVSLGQVVLPFIGLILIVAAVRSTGFVGLRGGLILDVVPTIGVVILAARWIGQQVFARSDEAALLSELPPERRAEGRLYATLLGLLLSLAGLLAAMIPYEGDTQTARVVLSFPMLLLGGVILFRLGQILVGAGRAGAETSERGTRARLLLLVGRAAMVLGVAGPLLAAVGYYTAARFFIFPAALSLALMASLALVQRLAADLYALATGRGDEAEEALVPVLIGFALVLTALPLLALIWGARVSDLTEIWARAREGFTIGETRIAPTDFLLFLAVFAVGYLATRLFQGALKSSVLPKTQLDAGGQNAVVSGVGYLGIFLAAIIAITSAGIDLSAFAIVAGALSVGIGFGLQNIVSNFISGIILLIERPISEGDWIEVGGQMGYVRDISVRSTRIETFDRTDVIVPNSELISGVVTNYTRGNLNGRIIVKVGVAYGSDTRLVERVLREIVEAHPLVVLNPRPGVVFMGFGADALEFEIRAILRDVNFSMSTRSDLNHEIARRFVEEGIEIPFAQRDIWLRNPEALTGAAPRAPKPAPARAPAPASEPIDPSLDDPPDPRESE